MFQRGGSGQQYDASTAKQQYRGFMENPGENTFGGWGG